MFQIIVIPQIPESRCNSTRIWFLDMDETSLSPKRGIEGLNSFQSVIAHDLVYWDPFSLKFALVKQIFLVGIHYTQL